MSGHNPDKLQAWRELIDAWKQSGLAINAFCRDRKLTRSNFDRWRRILAAEACEVPRDETSAFIPLRVVAEPMVEIVLRSGIMVRMPLSAAPDAVTRLVAAVGAVSC
jgi:hypothetical protein